MNYYFWQEVYNRLVISRCLSFEKMMMLFLVALEEMQ